MAIAELATEQTQITRAAVSALATTEDPTLDDHAELEVSGVRVKTVPDGNVVQVMGRLWAWSWGHPAALENGRFDADKVREQKFDAEVVTVPVWDDADLWEPDAWDEVRYEVKRQSHADRVGLKTNWRLWVDGVEVYPDE